MSKPSERKDRRPYEPPSVTLVHVDPIQELLATCGKNNLQLTECQTGGLSAT